MLHGPLDSGALQFRLNVSQATLSRRLAGEMQQQVTQLEAQIRRMA
ncbi:DNA-binding HxlR family transcriptional regulator [Erwinia toletana]|uniref:DNA-binding HxlR family transcriptional regulator n=1 Tax=Winslowiella toletana TaxID=92490 RepID=A0ABS4PAJ6_9GAMM|nr:hypothetical protein [Winslowiella toletana]MBP2169649.1 DNA-binding HxlR family transcriptional regulator [Winslowiella toletana]